MTTAKKPTTALSVLTTESIDGVPIVFREDGYINLTKIIREFPGKRLRDFWKTDEAQEYIETLSRIANIPAISLLVSRRGNGGGTWAHPKLAVRVARWLNTEFEVKCDLLIDNILRGNIQTTVAVPTLEAQQLLHVEAAPSTRDYLIDKRAEVLCRCFDAGPIDDSGPVAPVCIRLPQYMLNAQR
jgi:hypothetical protein